MDIIRIWLLLLLLLCESNPLPFHIWMKFKTLFRHFYQVGVLWMGCEWMSDKLLSKLWIYRCFLWMWIYTYKVIVVVCGTSRHIWHCVSFIQLLKKISRCLKKVWYLIMENEKTPIFIRNHFLSKWYLLTKLHSFPV